MPSIYEMTHKPEVQAVLDEMSGKLSGEFGVTLVGNRLTLRWYKGGELVSAHMILESVFTDQEAVEHSRQIKEMGEIIEKYGKVAPDLEAELFHAEMGEWPK